VSGWWAEDKAAEADALDASWKQVRDGTLLHENGHRRICYHYTDKLTDMLNHLRAWGYAPKEERARELGEIHYRKEWTIRVRAIQDEEDDKQALYDSPAGTNHGQNQGNWNWNQL